MLLRSRLVAAVFVTGLALPAAADEPPLAPKVLVITMFAGEAKPWLDETSFPRRIVVPGLTKAYPDVACSEDGICITTTGMGYANAASSISAVVLSGKLDLTKTYFIISGIAGVAPALGTLGSAHWARYAVDGGLQNEIDAREIPPGWSSGYLEIGAPAPGQQAEQHYGDQVYRLNEDLLQAAFRLTKDVELVDSDAAKAYRAKYAEPAATAPPQVSICDTISSDTWWFGDRLAEAMAASAKLITNGEANPCTTQQEDNATLTALKRGADAGLLDFNHIAILRTASDFDREPPGEGAAVSLTAHTGGFLPSVANAHRVAGRLARAIVDDWGTWSAGPPK